MSQKIVHGQQNQILKSRPMTQKIVHVRQNQILKVVRCRKKLSTGDKTKFWKSSDVARNCPRATKPNFKSRPMSQEIVHGQQNQILKSRPMSQETVHGQWN